MKSYFFTLLIIILNFSYAQIGEVIWEENFNDLDDWMIITGNGSWGWGNGELEFYQEENVEIAEVPGDQGNNALHITAQEESGPDIVDQWGNPLNYTSGKVTTKAKIAIKYGVIETRVRVPDLDLGGWPAEWMILSSIWNIKDFTDKAMLQQKNLGKIMHYLLVRDELFAKGMSLPSLLGVPWFKNLLKE